MTQEELISELEQAFYEDTGLMGVPTEISKLIDEHAEDDYWHWQMILFLEWTLEKIGEGSK